jgi:hypothetical protein
MDLDVVGSEISHFAGDGPTDVMAVEPHAVAAAARPHRTAAPMALRSRLACHPFDPRTAADRSTRELM